MKTPLFFEFTPSALARLARTARGDRARSGGRLLTATAVALAWLAAVLVPAGPARADGGDPSAPFTQCPSVGQSPSCKVLLVVNADGTVTVYDDPAVGDFDGLDDTLVGIVNNSGAYVPAVTVTGPGSDLGGFDGDGLCADITCTWPAPTGYEGPGTAFTNDPSGNDTVEVDFDSGGLAPGSSTYFSLEGTLTAAVLTARNGGLVPLGQTFGAGVCNCSGSTYPYQFQTAKPVNTATGALTERFTDIKVPATGIPFDFTRWYTSADTTSGPLGQGWTDPYLASAQVDASGNVLIRAEDGQQLSYTKRADGGFDTPPGARSVLTANGTNGWVLTEPDQRTLSFDADGHLTAMKDRLGLGLTLTYSSGVLSKVTDQAGREYMFTHDANGLLTKVALSDGRYVQYTYENGQLTTARDLRGMQTHYTYDTAGRLKSMTDPLGHTQFDNVYDAAGRVIQQTDARGKTTTFAWNPTTQTSTRTDPRGKTWTEVYADNVLQSIADPLGNTTSYGYDSRLNRTSITDPRGKVTMFTYDAAGNMLTKTGPAPSSVTESWTYTPFNAVATHTNGRGKTTNYEYFANQLLKKVTDPLNRSTSFTWTPDGLLDTVTDPRSKVTDFGYDADGNRTSILSPEGNKTTFGFDGFGRMTSMVEARGNVSGANPATYTTTYAYDPGNLLLSTTHPLEHVTTNTYDDAGNLSTVKDAEHNDTSYEYNADNQVTKVTDPRGGHVDTTYDDNGNVASVTTPAGETTFSYDDANRRIGEVTPRGHVTGATVSDFTWSYGFDANGNQTTVSNPTAGTTTTAFDELNRPVSVTDAQSNVTSTVYDDDSNVVSVTDQLSRVTGYGYDDADQLTSMTDPLAKTTSYGYDGSGNRTSQTSPPPLANERTWTYDGDGRLVAEVDPRGNVTGANPDDYKTVSAYDAAGHLTSVTDPEGHVTSYEYDPVGNLTKRTDANSHSTGYGYDVLDRLVSVTDPLNNETTYGYDDTGNLTSRTDANSHTTTYAYDLAGRLTQKTAPVKASPVVNQVWNYGYDAAGNLTSIETPAGSATAGTPGDGTITQTWDPIDRLTAVHYSDNPTTHDVSYGYDELRRTSMTDGTGLGAETYGYDDAGQLTSVTRGTNVFGYTYDDDGRLTTRNLPDGRTITQTWDNDSRPTSVHLGTQITADYDYDAAGNLTKTTLGNGIIETRTYDHTGWLMSIAAKHNTTVRSGTDYTRDAVGNPTLIDRTTNGATNQHERYTYDAADRLTQDCFASACLTAPKITYTYDPVGNRLTEVRGNVGKNGTITSTYNAGDQLTTASYKPLIGPAVDTTYTYDDNGNETGASSTSDTRTFSYDLANRTTAATINGATTSYTYDGNGLRLSSTTGTATTNYTWDQNYPLPEMVDETTPSGNRQFLLTPEGDPIALTNPGSGSTSGTFYYHADGIGSIRALTDFNSIVQATYAYEPFGTPRNSNDAIPNTIRYTGEYTDPNTGLSHLRARDYDPTTGRLTAQDPITQDIHDPYVAQYVYVDNRPTYLIDPSGLCAWYDAPCQAREAAEKAAELAGEGLEQAGDAVVDAGNATVGAVNRALPVIHDVANDVATVASFCAVLTSETLVGGLTCGSIALAASGVSLSTGAVLYAQGRESGRALALDSAGFGLSVVGSAAQAGAGLAHLTSAFAREQCAQARLDAAAAPWYRRLGPTLSSIIYGAKADLFQFVDTSLTRVSQFLSGVSFGLGMYSSGTFGQ